jgi:cysteine synthase B
MAMLRALGAEVIVTDALEGSDGAILAARQLAQEQPERFYYANQYDNPANWEAHYLTTGPELVEQTRGLLTHFVAGLGTSGTFTGAGRYIRERIPGAQLVAVQPDSAFHGLEGLKHMASCMVPGIFDAGLADQVLAVGTEEAYLMVRRLAREEGLLVGISSGAAAVAALRVAATLEEGVVVAIFPDAGYKYLSQRALWEVAA